MLMTFKIVGVEWVMGVVTPTNDSSEIFGWDFLEKINFFFKIKFHLF
jgi:hypothetical protein